MISFVESHLPLLLIVFTLLSLFSVFMVAWWERNLPKDQVNYILPAGIAILIGSFLWADLRPLYGVLFAVLMIAIGVVLVKTLGRK